MWDDLKLAIVARRPNMRGRKDSTAKKVRANDPSNPRGLRYPWTFTAELHLDDFQRIDYTDFVTARFNRFCKPKRVARHMEDEAGKRPIFGGSIFPETVGNYILEWMLEWSSERKGSSGGGFWIPERERHAMDASKKKGGSKPLISGS